MTNEELIRELDRELEKSYKNKDYIYFFDSDSLFRWCMRNGKGDFIDYLISILGVNPYKTWDDIFSNYNAKALFNKYHREIDRYEANLFED